MQSAFYHMSYAAATTNSDKDALNMIMQTFEHCRLDYGNAWELYNELLAKAVDN